MTALATGFGWGVAHSVWQGAIAAAALGAVLAATRSARARYVAGCAAFLLMAAAFGATVWRSIPDGARRETAAFRARLTAVEGGDPSRAIEAADNLSSAMPWVCGFWAAGVLVFQLRFAAGWRTARRLRRTGVCAPMPPWAERLEALKTRLRVSRAVALLESSLAETPAVIGHLRPVILVPAGLLAGLSPAQVEAILLHELAHIRRGDYLVNLLQTVAEGIFFYHPAAWWISSVMRREREHCCDDLVLAAHGDAREYATALAALERNRRAGEPALAATGGSLVIRIRRILRAPEGPRANWAPALAAAAIVIVAATALYGWQSRRSRPPQSRAELATLYQKWVNEDVAYIIDDRERARFASLATDEERERFIEQFWERRDPTPGTRANEFKEEHYRRIAYANERFADGIPGWKTDRGRVYIVYGPADEIESHPSGSATANYPFEEWRYRKIQGIGNDVILRFEDRDRTGEFRQTRK